MAPTDLASQLSGWRGRNLVSSDGSNIGTIINIYLDDDTGQPEWLAVATDMFDGRVSFVPLAGATAQGDDLACRWTKDQVKDAPTAENDDQLTQDEEAALYRHYGMSYSKNVSKSGLPEGGHAGGRYAFADTLRDTSSPTTDSAMTRSEEQSRVGTQRQEAGGSGTTTTPLGGGGTATVAADQAKQVASTAGEGAKEVAGEARQQARQVTGVARQQALGAMRSAQGELRGHASQQTDRAAQGLRGLAGQIHALVEGRTEEAGRAGDYARQAGDKAHELAARLENGGFDGVVEDVRGFARRRPGLFLIGAAAAGFAVGRMIRASTGDDDQAGMDASGRYALAGSELGTGSEYLTASDYPATTDYLPPGPDYSTGGPGYPARGDYPSGGDFAPPAPDYRTAGSAGGVAGEETLLAEPDLGTRAPDRGYDGGAR